MWQFAKKVTSRVVRFSALGALAVSSQSFARTPAPRPIPATAISHMTINVSDPARSLEWNQGLFGMPIVARQANTVILRVGGGPQFLAIAGEASSRPRIAHIGLSTDDVDAERLLETLDKHGDTSRRSEHAWPSASEGGFGVSFRQACVLQVLPIGLENTTITSITATHLVREMARAKIATTPKGTEVAKCDTSAGWVTPDYRGTYD